jgi:bifunctional aspartokinase / homoserine dehydrogenase 1
MDILVMKFGGTSVGSSAAMAQAVDIVASSLAKWPAVVVVTSALSGVTDLLLNSAQKSVQGDVHTVVQAAAELRRRHSEQINSLVRSAAEQKKAVRQVGLLIDEFSTLCHAIAVLGEATPRALDAVASLGERMCLPVFTAALAAAGVKAESVEATQLIVTDDHFQQAMPDMAATTRRTRLELGPLLAQGKTPVVTGFLGATPAGVTTTLGRGGSDFSAAILGAALPASEVWIWTDVDGVMTADPRLAPEARTIPTLSYREIAEMSFYGAKVVHPKTIRPVIEAGISLRVCNTFNPANPGTSLVRELEGSQNGGLKAVTAIRGLRLITLEGRGMLGVVGVSARTLTTVAKMGISVPLVTQASSEQSICFAVPSEAAATAIAALEAEFQVEMLRRDVDRVWATDEVVIISVVGADMIRTPGIAGKVFSALGAEGINIIAIVQGSSEVSICLVVDAQDLRRAVCTLHALIVAEGKGNEAIRQMGN